MGIRSSNLAPLLVLEGTTNYGFDCSEVQSLGIFVKNIVWDTIMKKGKVWDFVDVSYADVVNFVIFH